jgi:hypothetical protein
MNLDKIKETLGQAQRAQSNNWGHLYYRDVSALVAALELELNGGQGAIAAYHKTLDDLGAPPNEWPCIRVNKLVKSLRKELQQCQDTLTSHSWRASF